MNHSIIITIDGSVFSAGFGNFGQLGVWLQEKMPNTKFLKNNYDEIIKCNYFYKLPEFGQHNEAKMAACGENFSIVLTGFFFSTINFVNNFFLKINIQRKNILFVF